MSLIITAIHVLAALALIGVVLLQKGSGADMGAAFGGSSQNVFGAQGSGSFLGKLTAGLAGLFMLTSLTLAFFTTQEGAGVSVMDQGVAVEQPADAPTAADPSADVAPIPAKQAEPMAESSGAKPVPVGD
ncbi:preprotein translocase subunit SecG [Magnetofaba australis]|uniref:Protein-export membrane protein SecG n=1 Tax=Magnetofaba australis IT-1 TaxID=1434232 RepID=A0A1Y2K5X5_9PROT|nr:preprotein translocase subunit SecG [Magnetofaba australis]OSM05112.1 putative protein translocase subunit secG [Magnetofaba australis IT-1]